MQILPNGQVQIANSQTGETKIVDPMQLGSISPFLANQYYAYAIQQKALDKAKAGTGTGAGTDVLTPPTGTDSLTATGTTPTNSNQNTPDLSGLSQYATPSTPVNITTNTPGLSFAPSNKQSNIPSNPIQSVLGNIGNTFNYMNKEQQMGQQAQKNLNKNNPLAWLGLTR